MQPDQVPTHPPSPSPASGPAATTTRGSRARLTQVLGQTSLRSLLSMGVAFILLLSLASMMAVLDMTLHSAPGLDAPVPVLSPGTSAHQLSQGVAAGVPDLGAVDDRERLAAWAAQIELKVLTAGLVCVLTGTLLAWLAGSWLEESFHGLAEALQRVADGEESQVLPRRGPRDLVTVIMALDSTVAVLGEHRRQLTECMVDHAAASHQLHAASKALLTASTHSRGRTELALLGTQKISSKDHAVTISLSEMTATTVALQQHAHTALQAAQHSREQMQSFTSTVQTLDAKRQSLTPLVSIVDSLTRLTNALVPIDEPQTQGEPKATIDLQVVKTLAQQWAMAGDDANARLSSINHDIAFITEESRHLSAMIESIEDTQGALATTIEQQALTASEIRDLFTATVQTNQALSASIQAIAESTQVTSVHAEEINHLAGILVNLSYEVEPLVGGLPLPRSSSAARRAYDRRQGPAEAAKEAQRQAELF
jgi:hypothetical protein